MNDLPHVTNGEATERSVLLEDLDAHGLARNHLDVGRVAGLEELGGSLKILVGTTIDLLDELGELAGNVGRVAVENRSVASTDLTRVVQNDDLGSEGLGGLGRVVLGVTADVATTDFLDRDVLHVEADVVARGTLSELLVVHLDGLDFLIVVSRRRTRRA